MIPPKLIVWDFDGVLNANERAGEFLWARHLHHDLGLDPKALATFLFASGRIKPVMRGQHDLRDLLADWLATQSTAITADQLLTYWFEQDALTDMQVLGWLKAHPARHVIGTNNETRRCAYIEDDMGFASHVEHVFSSGRMGVAKPDPGFFAMIERWAALPPPAILLIDDAPANVAAAKARGWQGFLFNDASRASLPGVLGLDG